MTKESDDKLAAKKARFKVLEEYWADNRKYFLEDKKFAAGEQWPPKIVEAREKDGRPCLTVDKSGQYIRQVVNDSRQNRPSIKVRPIDDEGDIEVAEALQGVVMHVQDRSNADEAYDCGIENIVIGGFGYISVNTEYAHENTFNQEIRIDREPNPLAILYAPHRKADGSDAQDCFRYVDMPKSVFEQEHPDAEVTDWEADGYKDEWSDDNTVRVCEHWWKVITKVPKLLLSDGTVVTKREYEEAAVALGLQALPQIVDERELPEVSVKWCRMTGAEILEERDWLGKHLPIVPVYGNETNIEGKTIYSGLIRSAKDAMRLYNYSRTAFAESLALANKVPFIGSAEAIEGFEAEWQNANNSTASILHVNAFNAQGEPIPPPQRQQSVVAPQGFAQDMQLSEHDIQTAMGMFNASLGERSNEKSGKAIIARQREGDTATFHFQDNLNRAIRRVGVIVVDLIPKVYDSKRVIRLLGESGEATEAEVDPDQPQAVVKQGSKSIYNLSIGTYDVNISAGASYTTRRVEQAEAMMQMAQANPQAWMTHGDLIAKSQDWPDSEGWAERSRLVMPPELRQAIEQSEQEGAGSPEMMQAQQYVDQAMQQVQQQQQQMQQAAQQLQQMQQANEVDKAAIDAQTAQLQAEREKLESARKVYESRYQELSAKLELQAQKLLMTVPPEMPPGKEEPAISPQQPQPADAGFFTPNES